MTFLKKDAKPSAKCLWCGVRRSYLSELVEWPQRCGWRAILHPTFLSHNSLNYMLMPSSHSIDHAISTSFENARKARDQGHSTSNHVKDQWIIVPNLFISPTVYRKPAHLLPMSYASFSFHLSFWRWHRLSAIKNHSFLSNERYVPCGSKGQYGRQEGHIWMCHMHKSVYTV
jgi:hypothetical protein